MEAFFRTELTYTDYDDVAFTGSADADSVSNKIDADIDCSCSLEFQLVKHFNYQ